MMLLLTAIDPKGSVQTFSYEVPNIEYGFDLLSDVAARGYVLVRAQLVEVCQWTYLPVEAFDGEPVSPVIRALEKEWQQILHKPLGVGPIFNKFDNDNKLSQTEMINPHCIVYFSTSVGLFEEEELTSILYQSEQHNRQMDITGILLYVQGKIVQVLEGQRVVIEDLFNRIQRDRRHTDVTCVVNCRIQERLFNKWNMGYETLTAHQLDVLEAIIDLENVLPTPSTDQPTVLQMIKAFYDLNRLR